MTEEKKQRVYQEYSANNMAKLRQIVYKSVSMFGGLSQMDFDDFLSSANLTLWQLAESFDEDQGVPFEAYLRKRLPLKIMQEKTYLGRDKRIQYMRDKEGNKVKDEEGRFIEILPVYMDAPREDGVDFSEMLTSDFNIENELSEEFGLSSDDKIQKYLDRLSKKQRKIVSLLADGYPQEEIRELLHITQKEYTDHMLAIRSYENVKVLY